MGKRIAIAVIVIAVVVAIAGLIFRALFSGEARDALPQATSTLAPSAELDAGSVPKADSSVVVKRAAGKVERRVAADKWEPVVTGATLSKDDVIRTGDDGALDLVVSGVAVGVDANTQISLPQLSAAGLIRVGEGRVAANVPRRGEDFRVEVEGSDAVARSKQGEFAVLAEKGGNTTVASQKGSVRLSAKNKEVRIKQGQLATVQPGKPPSSPRAIPASLFVKIRQPGRVQRARRLKLAGKTTPGAVISINGVRVQVGSDGSFDRVVALKEGDNEIDVVGKDVTGRKERSTVKVTLDTRAPSVGGNMTWGK